LLVIVVGRAIDNAAPPDDPAPPAGIGTTPGGIALPLPPLPPLPWITPLLTTVTVSVGLNAAGTKNAKVLVEVLPTVTPGLTVTVMSELPAT
jgi:hypothetical protein